jgi:hypothetical protein
MPPTDRERTLQTALADFVFTAVEHALHEMPWTTLDPGHELLHDTIIEVIPYSDYHALVKVTDAGRNYTYEIKVHRA